MKKCAPLVCASFLALGASGCAGCGTPSRADASAERAAFPDATPPADSPPEDNLDVHVPPWADGAYLVDGVLHEAYQAPSACPGAELVWPGGSANGFETRCVIDNNLFISNPAAAISVNPPNSTARSLTDNIFVSIPHQGLSGYSSAVCSGNDVLFFLGMTSYHQSAVVRWHPQTPSQPASVLWSASFVRPADAQSYWSPSWYSPTATEQFAAWIFRENGYYGVLYLMPFSDGVIRRYTPIQPPGGSVVNQLRSSRNHLLFMQDNNGHSQDLWLWTLGDPSPQPLVVADRDQYTPMISGNTVVWTDARHGNGDLLDQDNPEIYWMDLTDRVEHRLTNTSASPTLKSFPDVSDEWIVWLDARNNPVPNAGDFQSVSRAELFGYHRPTGRMLPIYTGEVVAGPPRILGSHVYFDCAPSPTAGRALYRVPLPTP